MVSPARRGRAAAKAATAIAESEALGTKFKNLIILFLKMPTSIGLSAIPRVAQLFIPREALSRESLLLFHPPPYIAYNQVVT